MAEVKPLVINSKEALQGGSGKWQDFSSNIQSFTRSIITPPLSEMADVSAMVSGVPSVFARESLFVHSLTEADALRNAQKKEEDSGLGSYYLNLIDQWRGLLAFIALNSGKLEVRRITLAYSDGKPKDTTSNIYETKGALGNMLFEDRVLWTDPADPSKNKMPFIYVIKHNGKVIGGTSPRALLFTSVSYSISEDSPCVDVKTKKLTDPLQNNPNKEQLAALYAYIKQLEPKVEKMEKKYEGRIDYKAVKHELANWEREIYDKLEEDEREKSSPWPINLFKSSPFNIFDYSDSLYGNNGVIYSEETEGALEFDANDLLLPKDSVIARLEVKDDKQDIIPVFALKARIVDNNDGNKGHAFFALPLSETALKVFNTQQSLKALLGDDNSQGGIEIKSSLEAWYSAKNCKLQVCLDVVTDNDKQKTINMEYPVENKPICGNDILIWPNFIDEKWTKYYMYSELPHNVTSSSCKFVARPFVGEVEQDFKHIIDNDGNIKYLDKSKLIVLSDYSRTSDRPYKYEIYESDKPFKGIEMKQNGHSGGFFVIKYDTIPDNSIPTYYNKTLKDITVGIDFGSTNTAVAYFDSNSSDAEGFELKNQVISLLQAGSQQQSDFGSVEKNLLFFQSNDTYSNAIKSILAVHSEQYLPQDEISNPTLRNHYIEEPVKGGMPSFGRAIRIKRVEGSRLIANIGNKTEITLIHNMKWEDDDVEKAHKTAYLGSLLLHVYATLFEKGYVPTKLNWSYPSAMGGTMVGQYGNIWDRLKDIRPVQGKNIEVAKPDTIGGSVIDLFDTASFDSKDSDNDSENIDNGFDFGTYLGTSRKTEKKTVAIDTGEGEPFKFSTIEPNTALTEACAVANYLYRSFNGAGSMIVNFDIGGSTTDVTVLCEHDSKKYMLKQNSIRFAAQRIAFASKEVYKSFGKVLQNVCHNKHKILGLNNGVELYSKETAPYFFEQVVDILNDRELEDLYRQISNNCPGLFASNLYVTGLIMFYGGQIITKLVNEIKRSDKFEGFGVNGKPNQITVTFTGKGARIMEWLDVVNSKQAYNYYMTMLLTGMGGKEVVPDIINVGIARPVVLKIRRSQSDEVKFEVAKGLAKADANATQQLNVNNNKVEILGEEGFALKNPDTGEYKTISFDHSITENMMKHIGNEFMAPMQIEAKETKFYQFATQFYNMASHFGFSMKAEDIKNGIEDMNFNSYIRDLPEFRKAFKKDGKDFDFVAPIIILEGMKFYEEYLLKGIKEK